MDKVAHLLPPMEIIESYERAGASTRHASLNAMWNDLGDATAAVMVQGAVHLAMMWESAWIHGDEGPRSPLKASPARRG